MEKGRGILNVIHLESANTTSFPEFYTQSMKTASRLYPNREPYITHRMVNEVAGKSIRREWNQLDGEMRQHMKVKGEVGRESKLALRQQGLNAICGNNCY